MILAQMGLTAAAQTAHQLGWSEFGLAGLSIAGLGSFILFLVRSHREERTEIIEGHREERSEWRRDATARQQLAAERESHIIEVLGDLTEAIKKQNGNHAQ